MKTLFNVFIAALLYGCLASSALAAYAVNINTASAEQLEEALDGIGRQKAEAIVEYRKKHGDFKKAEDLLEIKGIGEKTLERNREFIQLK